MKYWWVNQNQTYDHEVNGGYLWSPKVNANGARNQFYDNMMLASVGDVVFSFCDTYIKAIGVVKEKAVPSTKPTEFGDVGSNWSDEGWFLTVDYTILEAPIKPAFYMSELAPVLPNKYSPLQENGRGNQGVYLAFVPDEMASILVKLLDGQVETILDNSVIVEDDFSNYEEAKEIIFARADIEETEKKQLSNARRGQGLFRSRVSMVEKGCRVTGVTEKAHLRASHIKPWADSTDEEKLDGNNGLLLSPHIDHLFDRGYISFSDEGDLMVSHKLNSEILKTWSIESESNFGSFNQQQRKYLAYHRQNKFLS
jgi:HNH endonuclease